MRRAAVAIVLVPALYFAIVFFVPLADRLVLFPTTFELSAGEAKSKLLPLNGGNLEVWTAASPGARQKPGPDAYLLRFYGNADRADRWVALEAQEWDQHAVEVWGVNYPGFGRSSGPAGLRQMAEAGITAFDALHAAAGGKPIIVSGTSIGSTVALHIAAERKITGLVLQNPVALRQVILRGFGWWNLWLLAGPVAMQIPRELDSITNARRVTAPAVFLLAERDEIVAPRFQQLVVEAYAGEKRIITLPGAGHNSPIEGAVLGEVINAYEWLLPPR
ncbi:MAG: alpha/beta hydrolase [Chthoniobacterales bacterium]